MIRIEVDVSDAKRALDRVTDPGLPRKIADAVADEDVLPALMKYPPPSRKAMPMTGAQRRAFFAKLRSGEISVPYQRTGRLGRSFEKHPTHDGLALVSRLGYAEFVRGPGQAAYHKGNWQTLDQLATALEGDVALTATGVLVDAIGNP